MTLIEKEANKRALYINEHEVKYITVERGREQANIREIQIGNYKLETVDNFKYLGVMIKNRNDRSRKQNIEFKQEIKHTISTRVS